ESRVEPRIFLRPGLALEFRQCALVEGLCARDRIEQRLTVPPSERAGELADAREIGRRRGQRATDRYEWVVSDDSERRFVVPRGDTIPRAMQQLERSETARTQCFRSFQPQITDVIGSGHHSGPAQRFQLL